MSGIPDFAVLAKGQLLDHMALIANGVCIYESHRWVLGHFFPSGD